MFTIADVRASDYLLPHPVRRNSSVATGREFAAESASLALQAQPGLAEAPTSTMSVIVAKQPSLLPASQTGSRARPTRLSDRVKLSATSCCARPLKVTPTCTQKLGLLGTSKAWVCVQTAADVTSKQLASCREVSF